MELIEKIFKKSGWIAILEAIIFAVLGMVLIWNPEGIIKWISYILGAIFIVVGVFKTFNYVKSKGKYDLYNHELVYGLMAVVIGIVTIVYSGTIASILRIIIGIWIIYTALIRVSSSLKLRTAGIKAWTYCLGLAIIMFIGGLYIILNAGTIVMTVGIIMVAYAIIDIIEDIIFMKNVKELF